ncbi:hypothetical protein F4778DRAFT_784053 [Xylariomycetidae sp. FL2044]|nr:hypothetical protein F4778DRAFT_784053 [Xylariomycetidae sp. FL2044]
MKFTIASLSLALALLPSALATLPGTLELLVFQNGQRAGCVNRYGNFTTNHISCYPFRAFAIPGSEYQNVAGNALTKCSTDTGLLNCRVGEPAAFTQNGADLEHIGTGTSFSVNSIPTSTDDTVGVDIIVGGAGPIAVFLQVHGISG